MMRFLIPLVIVLLGVGIGSGAGWFLAPKPPEVPECACDQPADGTAAGEAPADETPPDYEYVDMNGQFVVPIIENDQVTGMMVMSLSLETEMGMREAVYAKEPKLRDEFLSILFGYSSIGGFADNYLDLDNLKVIRNDLTAKAQQIAGSIVNAVLIVDMIRQDI
ncbi:flagellar basal body-associated FliL family protein [Mangrovicoccus sp. HB161399]|uniref:flagellar basal body-associated FliL family protein n=1 Tax=Mangrovicoccus sp. HB161399 TaxID=2720392 RepID=UPI0015516B52|nr:flagellar basal body-associated FliL family protein [Mangrovicoccus sp. HB161399]